LALRAKITIQLIMEESLPLPPTVLFKKKSNRTHKLVNNSLNINNINDNPAAAADNQIILPKFNKSRGNHKKLSQNPSLNSSDETKPYFNNVNISSDYMENVEDEIIDLSSEEPNKLIENDKNSDSSFPTSNPTAGLHQHNLLQKYLVQSDQIINSLQSDLHESISCLAVDNQKLVESKEELKCCYNQYQFYTQLLLDMQPITLYLFHTNQSIRSCEKELYCFQREHSRANKELLDSYFNSLAYNTNTPGDVIETDEFGRDLNEVQKELAAERLEQLNSYLSSHGNIIFGYLSDKQFYSQFSPEYEALQREYSTQRAKMQSEISALIPAEDAEVINVTKIINSLQQWKNLYNDSYAAAYIHLMVPKLLTPFIKINLLATLPTVSADLLHNSNYIAIILKSYSNLQDIEQLTAEKLIDKLIIPYIIQSIANEFDCTDQRQNSNLLTHLQAIFRFNPNYFNYNTNQNIETLAQTIFKQFDSHIIRLIQAKQRFDQRGVDRIELLCHEFVYFRGVLLMEMLLFWLQHANQLATTQSQLFSGLEITQLAHKLLIHAIKPQLKYLLATLLNGNTNLTQINKLLRALASAFNNSPAAFSEITNQLHVLIPSPTVPALAQFLTSLS
jgi:hypothetical protein